MQEARVRSRGGEDPWGKELQPTTVFLTGEFHGQRSLVPLFEKLKLPDQLVVGEGRHSLLQPKTLSVSKQISTAGRQGPQAGLGRLWGQTGPVLLLGYPGLAGGHGVCLVIQDLKKPLLSWLSILWWLGFSSCCHGNLAGLTARWTQSWHRQVELVGPGEPNSRLS